MKSHIDNVLENLEFIVGSYKESHGGELKGVEVNTASTAYRYLLKKDCGTIGLIALDDLAREFRVDFSRFFLPLGEPTPKGKYYACNFPNNLQLYRRASGFSLSSLASEAGMSSGAPIKNYEVFKSVPSLETIQNIADALDIEVLEMFKLNKDLWKEDGII